jgi:hypothetical protein
MTFQLDAVDPGRSISWCQEVEGTSFARAVRESREEIRVERSGQGCTVSLTIDRRLRGTSRLGGWLAARGQRKQLVAALDGLERTLRV